MINKLKLGFLIAALSLSVGVGSANAIDLTFDAPVNVTIGSHTYVIAAGSAATSVVLATNGLSLDVEVPTSSTFTLVSADRDTLTTTGGTVTCTNTESTLVITGLTATTRTITPSTTACGPITGSGSGGGGGGGGGGSTYVPPTTTTTTTTVPGCSGNTGYSTTTGQSCAGNSITTVTTTPSVMAGCNGTVGYSTVSGLSCASNVGGNTTTTKTWFNFGTTTLKNGSRGEAVKELQRFLNQTLNLGLVVDGILGPKTIAVIKKWQMDHDLVADGLVGPKTKAMMNASVQ